MRNRKNHQRDLSAVRAAGLDRIVADSDLPLLAAHADIVDVSAGTCLVRAGTWPSEVLVLTDGYVEIIDESGVIGVAGPGASFGISEMVNHRQHTTTVIARSDVSLVAVFGPAFRWVTSPTAVDGFVAPVVQLRSTASVA